MVTKAQSKTAARNAKVREHYRQHRIQKPNGKFYNPLLDDPTHPDNIRGWTHGTLEGYQEAGCTYCESCAAAGREDAKRKEQLRLDRRLEAHRAVVRDCLSSRFPSLPAEVVEHGAELVIATHRVRQKFRALLAYEPVPVEHALNNWVLVQQVALDITDIPPLATELIRKLET